MNVSMSSAARSLAASAIGTDHSGQPLVMSQGSTITKNLPEFKSGRFGIDRIEVPQRVAVGDEVSVTIRLFNGFASNLNCNARTDPDIIQLLNPNPDSPCDAQSLVNSGPNLVSKHCAVCHRVSVTSGWGEEKSKGWKALAGATVGVPHYTQKYTFTAPSDPGTYAFDIEVQLSGGKTKSRAVEFTVEPRSCTSDAQCAQDEVCRNGICISPDETCTEDADCPEGYVCSENGRCTVDKGNDKGGKKTFIDQLIAAIPILGANDPFAQALASIAPGLLVVVLILILLPG